MYVQTMMVFSRKNKKPKLLNKASFETIEKSFHKIFAYERGWFLIATHTRKIDYIHLYSLRNCIHIACFKKYYTLETKQLIQNDQGLIVTPYQISEIWNLSTNLQLTLHVIEHHRLKKMMKFLYERINISWIFSRK